MTIKFVDRYPGYIKCDLFFKDIFKAINKCESAKLCCFSCDNHKQCKSPDRCSNDPHKCGWSSVNKKYVRS